MKRDYKGLTSRVIYTEPLRLLVASNQYKLKAKTNNEWQTVEEDLTVSSPTGEGVAVFGDEPGF